jgi:hypothetical protein
MARSSSSARQLNDHDEIREWAEERGGKPACVRGTGGGDDVGMIRIDFPGYSGADSLEEISWDEWFDKFDESNLTLLVQDQTARGQKSNFNKLVSRNKAQQRSRRRGSRNGADREEGRAAAKPSSSARGRSEGTRGRASSTRSRSGAKRKSKSRNQGSGTSSSGRRSGATRSSATRSSTTRKRTSRTGTKSRNSPSSRRSRSTRSSRSSSTRRRSSAGNVRSIGKRSRRSNSSTSARKRAA